MTNKKDSDRRVDRLFLILIDERFTIVFTLLSSILYIIHESFDLP